MRWARLSWGQRRPCPPVPSRDLAHAGLGDEDKGHRLAFRGSRYTPSGGVCGALPEGLAVTRNRARKKSVRAQMAASGEPYSVAARKLGSSGAPGEASARDEVITRVEATLAASSARYEVRKEVAADPVTAPAQNQHRFGPFKRLVGNAVKTARDHVVPEQARTRLRTAASGMATGIIEPSARRFRHYQVKQDLGTLALAMVITRPEFGGTPKAHVMTEDPLELLTRLRSVTAAGYAGEETVRDARCRKFAVTVSGSTAGFSVWVDDEHVRRIQAVTPETRERVVVTVLAMTTVTVQLWDFGVPVDSMDWPPLPPPAGRLLPLIQRRVQTHPARRPGQGLLAQAKRQPERGSPAPA